MTGSRKRVEEHDEWHLLCLWTAQGVTGGSRVALGGLSGCKFAYKGLVLHLHDVNRTELIL